MGSREEIVSKNPLTIEVIYRTHGRYIRGIVAYRVPAADVNDVMQEALIQIHRSLHTYSPARGALKAWLYVITRRVVVQYLRCLYRERERENLRAVVNGGLDATAIPDLAPGSEERMMVEQERQFLREIIARMPEGRREAFELHAVFDMTDSEVAQTVNAPENTVKSWIRLGWEDVERALKRRRAREHRYGAMVLPISGAALLARERARLADVSEDEIERTWARFQRTRDEERAPAATRAPEDDPAARSPSLPSFPSFPYPVRPMDARTVARISMTSAAAGGAIVWALLHGDPPRDITLTGVRSAVPMAEQMGGVRGGTSDASWMSSPAKFAATPPAVPSPLASPDAAPSAVASAARPSVSRPVAPQAPSGPEVVETEESLLQTATQAFERGDFEAARASLDHHAREYPNGRLATNREALRQQLPH